MPLKTLSGDVTVTKDESRRIMEGIRRLASMELYVGVPQEKAGRSDPGGKSEVNNAMLAYIHNYGSERAKIPPRPFMEPGIEKSRDFVIEVFKKAGGIALDKDPNFNKIEAFMNA